jgi:hypothetical protein
VSTVTNIRAKPPANKPQNKKRKRPLSRHRWASYKRQFSNWLWILPVFTEHGVRCSVSVTTWPRPPR